MTYRPGRASLLALAALAMVPGLPAAPRPVNRVPADAERERSRRRRMQLENAVRAARTATNGEIEQHNRAIEDKRRAKLARKGKGNMR